MYDPVWCIDPENLPITCTHALKARKILFNSLVPELSAHCDHQPARIQMGSLRQPLAGISNAQHLAFCAECCMVQIYDIQFHGVSVCSYVGEGRITYSDYFLSLAYQFIICVDPCHKVSSYVHDTKWYLKYSELVLPSVQQLW
jgi:hypothetical protein